jgi:hypothetical protein
MSHDARVAWVGLFVLGSLHGINPRWDGRGVMALPFDSGDADLAWPVPLPSCASVQGGARTSPVTETRSSWRNT